MRLSKPPEIFHAEAAKVKGLVGLSDTMPVPEFNHRVAESLKAIRELDYPEYLFSLNFMFPAHTVPGWREPARRDDIETISFYDRDNYGQLQFQKRANRRIRNHVMPLRGIELVHSKQSAILSGRCLVIESSADIETNESMLMVAPTSHKPIVISICHSVQSNA